MASYKKVKHREGGENIKGLYLKPVAIFILISPFFFWAGPAVAATKNASAQAQVVELVALSIVENQQLNFGRIQRPTITAQNFVIQNDGVLATGGSNGNFIDGQQVGKFTLNGTPSLSFNISGTPGSCQASTGNIDTEVNFNFIDLPTLSGPTFDGTGTFLVNIGGSINISTTAEGTGVCLYSLTLTAP
jgi:hypothetical protein